MNDRCGTYAGFQAHKKRGEVGCGPCRDARRVYMAAYREKSEKARERDRKYSLATSRARERLIRAHRAEFLLYLDEERRRLG